MKRKDSLGRLVWGGQVGRFFCEGLLEGKVDPFLGPSCSISLPNTELFCNMLLTVGLGQIWGNNQKHGFSTLSRKPECGSAQTDPEAAARSGVGRWKVSHEEASLGAAGRPLLGPPELIPYPTKPLLELFLAWRRKAIQTFLLLGALSNNLKSGISVLGDS